MKRKILTLASSFILSSAIYAQDINIQNGWQLLGATEDINVSKFDSSCIDYIWKYDSSNWQAYVANGQTYNYTGSTITSLNQGDGFWVKGNNVNGCDVNTSASVEQATFQFTTEWLNDKSLYYVTYDDFGYGTMKWNVGKMQFNETSFDFSEYNTSDSNIHNFNYSITDDGFITFVINHGDGDETQLIKVLSETNDYFNICWDNDCNSNNNLDKEYFYFEEQKALDFRDVKNAEILADSEVVTLSGQVNFKDTDGNTIAVPFDAGIRILSDTDTANQNWGNSFEIAINSDGTFSKTKTMYLNSYKEGHTFRVVVFKNHIKPDEMSENCGENVYKYVHDNNGVANFNIWSNIDVYPNDFQDNSSQNCGD